MNQRGVTSRRRKTEPARIATSDICILALNFPPEPTGIAPYVGALARDLAGAGHRVTAHVAHPHYPRWRIFDGYGRWTQTDCSGNLKVRRVRHYVPSSPRGVRRLLSEVTFGVRLVFSPWGSARVVIAVSPPLFSTAMVALRLRLGRRAPRFILWVQDIYSLGVAETAEGGALVRRMTRWIEGATSRSADQVVVIHPRFADVIAEFGVPRSRLVVVRNWTHLPPSERVERSAARAKLGWPRNGFLAVHTGNMGVKQGLENVVDAARLADQRGEDVHFVLVGDGGERRSLEQYGRGVSRLTFVDPLPDDDYRLCLGAADVLLVNEKPGVAAMAVPSKLTTYLDAGRPVIAATDPDGITASEVQTAKAGVIVPAGRPDALLDAVLSLSRDPELAAVYATNGRNHRLAELNESLALGQWRAVVAG